MKIILAGAIENISTRQDGSVKVTFSTQEMDSSNAGQLFQLRGKYVKCLLSDTGITDIEANVVDSEKMAGTKKKSQSARLRAVLYVGWEQSGLSIPFEDYYRTESERIIEHYKSKLNKEAA
jgi:hypothetical protein